MSYDAARLERILRNEADMAAARRLRVVLDYLDIQPGERVLDCGCGLGWFTHAIRQLHDCRLAAVDSGLDRLAVARRETPADVAVAAADILALPYADGAFDKIVLSEVLEHVADDEAALREVCRVLRPGGTIAITVPHSGYPLFWDPVNWVRERMGLAPIREGFFGGLWTHHLRLYSRSRLLDLVARAGLSVVSTRQHVHYCLPFTHNLVYGLGMRLVQSGALAGADRFCYDRARSRWNPLEMGRSVLRAIDRWNDPISDDGMSAVILSVRARRAGGSAG